MSDPLPNQQNQNSPVALVRANLGSTLLEAVVLLLMGFYLFGYFGDDPVYSPGNLLCLACRIGGFGLLGATVMRALGWPLALLADALMNAAISLVFIYIGAIWAYFGDIIGFLLLFFGVLSLNSARGTFADYRRIAGANAELYDRTRDRQEASPPTGSADKLDPGVNQGSVQAGGDEDGYLADLGRESETEES